MKKMSIQEKAKAFDDIRGFFGIGDNHPSFVTLTNVKNCKSHSDKLHGIEVKYFMVDGDVDEDYPEEGPVSECLLNSWGESTDEYVDNFVSALDILLQKRLTPAQQHADELVEKLNSLVYACENNTGAELSLSCYHFAIDDARELLERCK